MIDKELLEGVSWDLGVKARIVEADIRDLAWCWELSVGEVKILTHESIHQILVSITRAYLRGRGRRMGNWQGYLRHRYTQAALFVLIVQHVVEHPVMFESLHEAGVTSEEAYKDIKRKAVKKSLGLEYDILEESEKILRERPRDD